VAVGGIDGLELRILGPLELWRDRVAVPVPATRQRDLLAALALPPGRVLSTERLVELLWSEDPPATARNTLHTLVRRLRRRLAATPEQGARLLQTRTTGYLLDLAPEQVDAYRFDRLLRSGAQALDAGDPAAAVQLLDEALALFRGQALADVSSQELLRVEQPRLAELRLQAAEVHTDARLRCGEHAAVISELRKLVAENPLRERPYEQLMTALYRCGRQAEALETYQSMRQALTSQLGIEPGRSAQQLHQAVLRNDPDLDAPNLAPTTPATAPPPVPVAGVPEPAAPPAQLPAEPAGFTGRTAQLATLDRLRAGDEQDSSVVAIVGTAGVGKSALALRWGHRLRARFPDGQLFVDLQGFSTAPPLRPVDALGMFLRALGVPAQRVPGDEQEAAASYRSLLADRRVLVLLDNARDAAQVRPLLPAGGGCLAVVTSRNRLDSLVASEGAARLRLEPLPAGESRSLLARALGQPRLDEDPAAVDELGQLCAHLPLALRITAANLAGRATRLTSYLEQLRASRLDALQLAGDASPAVRASFELSYAVLGEPVQRVFRLLGCLPGIDLTAEAAAALAGVDRATAGRLLEQLAASHLVSETGSGRFGCHDLLSEYAVQLAAAMPAPDRASAAGALTRWYVVSAEAAVDLIHPDRLRLPAGAGAWPAPPPPPPPPAWQRAAQALSWLDVELPNLVAVAVHAANAGTPAASWRLATALRPYLSQRGYLPQLRAIAQAAAGAGAAAGDRIGQAAAQLALGTARWAQHQYPIAIDHYQEAVRLAEATGWREAAAAALNNLASAHQNAGRHAEAAAFYARAQRCYEELGRPEGRAAVLLNLGNTYWEIGSLDRAAEQLRGALDLFRLTGSRTAAAIALNNLGNVLLEQGQLDAALTHLTEALTINQETGNRVSEAGTLRALATVHSDAGRLAPARELAESALQLARQTRHHMYEAAALDTLATVHRRDGRPEQALSCYREALAVIAQAGHPHLEAQIHLGLAETYRVMTRQDLATTHAAQALTIARAHDYQRLERQAVAALPEPSGREP
jgi:DNA-binding SARP family transcriptional activator